MKMRKQLQPRSPVGRPRPVARMTRISRMVFCCSHGPMSRACGAASALTHLCPATAWQAEQDGYSICSKRGPVRRSLGEGGFSLVVALVMVALMAVIAVGVFTSVSRERITATSYSNRYQADLAVQNGLQAAAKTLAAAPFPSPVPTNFNATVTGNDAFLVVRADGPADGNGNKASYYYLAQPCSGANPTITYYPLFSASTDPSAPTPTPQPINLAATGAPAVPTPAPPGNSNPTDPGAAWNAAGTQRLPTLYSWQQPTSPSGVSVEWVEMRDPQDTAPAPAHNLSYTRYAYWVEDLGGYLDASQVSDPLYVNARAGVSPSPSPYTEGTNPKEIPMFTIFDPADQTDPGNTAATTLINNRPLLLTVPTVQQVAATNPDVAGPNLAVRLGVDNNPGEQNLVPLGYGYGSCASCGPNNTPLGEGYRKMAINPVSQFRPNGNAIGQFANIINTAMPNFQDRTLAAQPSGHGHSGQTLNYFNNLTANLFNYAYPLDAPTEFGPPGNPNGPPSYRGIGAYPFVVSLYDLNNWVDTVPIGTSYGVVIETKTYVQLWNPHNYPTDGLGGSLIVQYQNSDHVNVFGTDKILSSPPLTTIIFTANPDPNNRTNPVIVSPLVETGNVGLAFNYQIKAAIGYQDPQGKIKPNEYRVVALPGPTPACTPTGTGRNIYTYSASGLPPGLNLHGGGAKAGLIDGTPTPDPPYTNGYRDYSVAITATGSPCGTASATLVIRIYQ
jgi:Tfp pilus assembly protein PilX